MLIPINYEIQERSNGLYESIIVAEESDHNMCENGNENVW